MEYQKQQDSGKTSLTHKDAAFLELPKTLQPVLPHIIIEPLRADVIVPKYASDGDSGMDLYAPEDILILPGANVLVKLGFAMEIPVHPFHDWGYRWEAQVRPRSGVSLKTDLTVPNSPGTIDNFYVDEVGVIVRNTYKNDLELTTGFADDGDTIYSLETLEVNQAYDLKANTVEMETFVPNGTYLIRKGERFAQIVFNEIVRPLEIIVGKVDRSNDRGGGFGKSGV